MDTWEKDYGSASKMNCKMRFRDDAFLRGILWQEGVVVPHSNGGHCPRISYRQRDIVTVRNPILRSCRRTEGPSQLEHTVSYLDFSGQQQIPRQMPQELWRAG